MAQTDSPNPATGTRGGLTATVTPAHHPACGRCRRHARCWPHEGFPGAPAICGRCREVIDGMVADGELTPDVLDPPRPFPPEADCPVCAGPCQGASAPPPTPPLTTATPHDTLEVGGMPKRESPM